MLVSDFNPVWSTYHVFSNNNSYLCSSECPRIMKWIWVSLLDEPLVLLLWFLSARCEVLRKCQKSNVFVFFKKWEHANTNISARNQNDVSNKWKVSWKQDAVLECRLQVHTEALRGFLFLQWAWSKMLSHRCLIPENRWKRFCQDNIPKFPNLFIYLFIFISEIRWEKILRILFLMFKKWGKMSEGVLFIYLVWNLVKNRCWRFFTPMCESKWKKNSWNFFLKNQVNNFYPGVKKIK